MKILFLTQQLPFPPESGGPIKTLQTLKILTKKHQVFLACFTASRRDLKYQKHLKRFCSEVRAFPSNIPFDHFRNIRPVIFRSLFSPEPFIVYRYKDERFQKAAAEILEKEKIDAIHIDHLNLASYLPREKKQIWVLEQHNLESEINWGIARRERWNKFKVFSFLEALKLAIYEKRMISKFDYILAISEEDKRKLTKLGAKKDQVFFLPTSFATKPLFSFKKHQPIILFIGTLAWWPNKDGLFWFYKKVFPLIKRQIPKAKFVVIGKEATEEMISLDKNDPSLKFTGYVKNLEKYLAKASVFIVPLRAGSGIRVKILTALSAGIPVVSTKKGAEGMVSKSGKGVILADNPEVFAKAVMKVLKNKKLAERLSKAGLNFIEKNYNQQKAERVMKKVYP